MFVTNHVLAGVLVGRAVARHPVLAFAAGVASHVVMDVCPHWGTGREGFDQEFLRVARCDGCAGLTAMALAAGFSPGASRKAVIAGMAGAALPDADKPMAYFFGWNPFPPAVRRFHSRIQREAPHRLPHELVCGAVLAGAGILALSLSNPAVSPGRRGGPPRG